MLGAGASTTFAPSTPATTGTSTLSSGAVVGIIFGILLAFGLVIAVVLIGLYLVKKRWPLKGKYFTDISEENKKAYGLGIGLCFIVVRVYIHKKHEAH